MDIDALKTDLRKAVKLLPPEAIAKLADLLNYGMANMETLMPLFPKMQDLMSNHLYAGMMEKSVGMLDTNEIEAAVREVFSEAGIKPTGGGL